jgi:hypothetical protein
VIDEVGFETSDSLYSFDPTYSVTDGLIRYFFDKIEKKGIYGAAMVYDKYLNAGFSPKEAIALTDRRFFPEPHKAGHGNYLRNVIGDALFQKEQAARKGKNDWISLDLHRQGCKTLDEKINSTALQALDASLKTVSANSNQHKLNRERSLGGYLLGLAQIVAGGAIIATSGVLEVATCGGFTFGCAATIGTGLTLITTGIATTTLHGKDISSPKFPKHDPSLEIVNKTKERPKRGDEPGAPPIRGDQLVGDGKISPYPGFDEWVGSGDPSSGKGSWYNPETDQSLHPDLNHPSPDKPHWDYKGPGSSPKGEKLYLDGTWVPK